MMKIQYVAKTIKGFKMEKLPYGYGDLEPVLSANEVKYHYSKHTKSYFEKLNELVKGTKRADYDTLTLLVQSKQVKLDEKLFNQAAQALNHTFYWACLTPESQSGQPSDQLLNELNATFGSFDKFKKEFNEKAASQFGSGWAWLVLHNDKLTIETTADGQTPFVSQTATPLLCVDVWEHAYLYDDKYVANRKKYLDNIWKIINWNYVNGIYASKVVA